MGSAIDLEAQQATPPHVEVGPRAVGESETHDVATLRTRASSDADTSPVRPLSTGQDVEYETQPIISQSEGSGGNSIPEMNTNQSQRNGVDNANGDRPTQAEAGQNQNEAQSSVVNDSGPNGTSDPECNKEKHMMHDFDGSSKALWTLFGTETKSCDNAQINTLKDDMGGVLIFAGLFSAALTAFVIDSKNNLQVKPKDEMVYYLQQHSTILSQISLQLSFISPQVSIPSTPPPSYPKFNPLASDIRINFFWFMALVFSLFAALLAIFVQQWVRDYMHVFQQHSDPLKSARLRQYLREGSDRWHLPRVAKAVSGLLHISLFLFFTGLVDSLLHINTTVGLSAIIPIGIGVLLYIFAIFAPIIYPQSPYQNTFSGVIWYLFQKLLHWRQYEDHGPNGGQKPVSTNMAKGQMQLAMDEGPKEERKGRDVQAIQWLINNLTGDTEMEQFLMAIPGSFNTKWGVEVWKKVGNMIEDKSKDQSQNEPVVGPVMRTFRTIIQLVRTPTSHHPPTHVTAPSALHKLSTRVARSLEACKNRGHFANDDWQKHTRACIETTASLVFGAKANFAWFGDIAKLLGDIGVSEKPRELSSAGTDQVFVMHWTCLSLVAIRQILEGNQQQVRDYADLAVGSLAGEDDASDAQALAGARKVDKILENARECLYHIYGALRKTENLTEVKEILRNDVSKISDLENINIDIEAERLGNVDQRISATQLITHRITSQIPGVPNSLDPVHVPFGHLVEHFRDPRKLQFIRPGQTLKSLCSVVPTLRNILKGQGDADAYKEMKKDLQEFHLRMFNWRDNEVQRQLWRLQDLRHGCGFGFTVELFFLAFSQLLSTSSSKDSHSALYTGAFREITSDWSKHKTSHGTRKLLLDIALSRSFDFQDEYPKYIVHEFLQLMGKIFEGQEGVLIDEAKEQLNSFKSYANETFWDTLWDVIVPARAP